MDWRIKPSNPYLSVRSSRLDSFPTLTITLAFSSPPSSLACSCLCCLRTDSPVWEVPDSLLTANLKGCSPVWALGSIYGIYWPCSSLIAPLSLSVLPLFLLFQLLFPFLSLFWPFPLHQASICGCSSHHAPAQDNLSLPHTPPVTNLPRLPNLSPS